MNNKTYLDTNATTKVRKEVIEAMLPYYNKYYGNPSSLHSHGSDAAKAVSESREYLASLLFASPDEIFFTSGGTESDNWALDIASRYANPHIVVSSIEHHAIIRKCEALWREGTRVSYLDVDREGFVNMSSLMKNLKSPTTLVSVMAVNNEVGTIEPIRKIGEMARNHGALFHTDAVAAFTKIPIDVRRDNIDMLSATAHKIHGPKGVGLLYVSKNVKIEPMIYGGGQERGFRGGTENVPGIVGFAKAAMLGIRDMNINRKKMIRLKEYMLDRIMREIPGTVLIGPNYQRLPSNICLAFDGVEGQSLAFLLDGRGLSVSTGSACQSHEEGASHVLKAMGYTTDEAFRAIRISLDENNSVEDVDETVNAIKEIVKEYRDKGI